MSDRQADSAESQPTGNHTRLIGIILAGIALIGPVCGLLAGEGAAGARLAQGWYSAPILLFAIPAFFLSIRNTSDYIGGAVLAILGFFALWAASDLSGMRGYSFGPGSAPRLFAYALIVCGAAVSLSGFFTDDESDRKFALSGPLGGAILILAPIPIGYFLKNPTSIDFGFSPSVAGGGLSVLTLVALAFLLARFMPRGPVFITAAVLIFAIAVRPLGLVIASFVSIMIVAQATDERRWVETVIWAAVLTIFCALLFPYTLGLPLQPWPQF